MKKTLVTLTGLSRCLPIKTIGIGVFDGLHLGHQAISSKVDTLLSFTPHPTRVLGKKRYRGLLTTPREMRELFPRMVFVQFNREVADLSPEAFLNDVMRDQIKPEKIVVGYDFFFGKNKAGDTRFLKKWCKDHGIACEIISPNRLKGEPVKSSSCREFIARGKFAEAVTHMGHPYVMIGQVVHGDGRGKSLGFPTANLKFPEEKLIPSAGVYQGTVLLDQTDYQAMIYIGSKPTFQGEGVHVEVYLPDYDGDLYGRILTVYIQQKVRGEKTFTSKEALQAQIQDDLSILS